MAVDAAGAGANLGETNFGAAMFLDRFGCRTSGAGAGRETNGRAVGALGAMRATEGAAGAERRAKGSTRCKGVGLEIAGATIALGWDDAIFGCVDEKLGRGGAGFATGIIGEANAGSSNGR